MSLFAASCFLVLPAQVPKAKLVLQEVTVQEHPEVTEALAAAALVQIMDLLVVLDLLDPPLAVPVVLAEAVVVIPALEVTP